LPAMDHASGAKESAYRPALGREILRRVARGETVKSIAADPNMPSYATIFRWRQVIPEFGERWRALRGELAVERMEKWDRRAEARVFWRAQKARREGRRPPWRRGRPSSYTAAVGRAICRRLRKGETMMSINADPAMPSAKVVYRWLRTEPAFRAMVMAARRHAVGWLEFQSLVAWDELEPVRGSAARVARKAETLLGRAGRITPKVYGRPEKFFG